MFRRILVASGRVGATKVALRASSSSVTVERTATTARLWRLRKNLPTGGDEDPVASPVAPATLTCPLPLKSDPLHASQMAGLGSLVRSGRILEDLDSVAASTAHLHCQDPKNHKARRLGVVTAAVDQIDVLADISADKDYTYAGRVTWTGGRSLEVTVSLHEAEEGCADDCMPSTPSLLRSTFVMVPKDPKTGRAVTVNPLDLDHVKATAQDRLLFDAGSAAQEVRVRERHEAQKTLQPSPQEGDWISKQLLRKDVPAVNVHGAPELAMCSTYSGVDSVATMFPQQENMAGTGTVFGGYLMHLGYNAALSNVSMLLPPSKDGTAKNWARLTSTDRITFPVPVKVGDILSLKSRVWATRGSLAYVNVESSTLTPATGEEKDACSFSFVFRALESDSETAEVGLVDFPSTMIPTSYLQALRSLNGKRRLADVARGQPTSFQA